MKRRDLRRAAVHPQRPRLDRPLSPDRARRAELNGEDLRREPIERRKAALAKLLRHAKAGLLLNQHIEYDDGEMVFHHACKLGLEGIVSKRLGSPYRSGRSRHWVKSKNPKHPAVKREAEEDWGR